MSTKASLATDAKAKLLMEQRRECLLQRQMHLKEALELDTQILSIDQDLARLSADTTSVVVGATSENDSDPTTFTPVVWELIVSCLDLASFHELAMACSGALPASPMMFSFLQAGPSLQTRTWNVDQLCCHRHHFTKLTDAERRLHVNDADYDPSTLWSVQGGYWCAIDLLRTILAIVHEMSDDSFWSTAVFTAEGKDYRVKDGAEFRGFHLWTGSSRRGQKDVIMRDITPNVAKNIPKLLRERTAHRETFHMEFEISCVESRDSPYKGPAGIASCELWRPDHRSTSWDLWPCGITWSCRRPITNPHIPPDGNEGRVIWKADVYATPYPSSRIIKAINPHAPLCWMGPRILPKKCAWCGSLPCLFVGHPKGRMCSCGCDQWLCGGCRNTQQPQLSMWIDDGLVFAQNTCLQRLETKAWIQRCQSMEALRGSRSSTRTKKKQTCLLCHGPTDRCEQ